MLVGHKKVTCHLVFDVKTYFTRKYSWVLDGHNSFLPKALHILALCLDRLKEHFLLMIHSIDLICLQLILEILGFKHQHWRSIILHII